LLLCREEERKSAEALENLIPEAERKDKEGKTALHRAALKPGTTDMSKTLVTSLHRVNTVGCHTGSMLVILSFALLKKL